MPRRAFNAHGASRMLSPLHRRHSIANELARRVFDGVRAATRALRRTVRRRAALLLTMLHASLLPWTRTRSSTDTHAPLRDYGYRAIGHCGCTAVGSYMYGVHVQYSRYSGPAIFDCRAYRINDNDNDIDNDNTLRCYPGQYDQCIYSYRFTVDELRISLSGKWLGA